MHRYQYKFIAVGVGVDRIRSGVVFSYALLLLWNLAWSRQVPCGSVFALTEPALDRSHAHDSANITLSLFRGVLHRAAYSFLCCNLPVHGMSRSTDTNITCLRVLSDIPVEFCLNDSGMGIWFCV